MSAVRITLFELRALLCTAVLYASVSVSQQRDLIDSFLRLFFDKNV
jgi:hypothetical protein